MAVIALVVFGGSVYANLAHDVKDSQDYKYFPPFQSHRNRNLVDHLGSEYKYVAQAIYAGRGYSEPFGRDTGPTSWVPPILTYLTAGVYFVAGGDTDTVANVFVVFHCAALIWTGLFVLCARQREHPRARERLAVCILVLAIAADFKNAFQFTHDHFLVLSALNGLVLWAGWGRPLGSRSRSVGWGLFGGFAALCTPTLGCVWAGLTVLVARREQVLSRVALAGLGAAVALTPWLVRNYVTFGQVIPVKSNLNYELYQSQCMQPDGTLQWSHIPQHPGTGGSEQAREYDELGESAFLARKGEQFRTAVREDPGDFADRVADRFLAIIIWYTPLERTKTRREFTPGVWLSRVLHPLPWVAVAMIALSIGGRPTFQDRVVAAAAALYVLPYILASYDARYYFALLGLRVLLMLYLVDRLVDAVRRPRAS
jgi:hypothetical protein